LRILVAEDEKGIAEIYKIFLEDEGHEVVVTSNGDECIASYNDSISDSKPFDFMIVDYRMPFQDGVSVIRKILELNPAQKLLIATAYGSEMDHNIPRGITILRKPFEIDDLIEAINQLVKQ